MNPLSLYSNDRGRLFNDAFEAGKLLFTAEHVGAADGETAPILPLNNLSFVPKPSDQIQLGDGS
jgi:hypothetical protein